MAISDKDIVESILLEEYPWAYAIEDVVVQGVLVCAKVVFYADEDLHVLVNLDSGEVIETGA